VPLIIVIIDDHAGSESRRSNRAGRAPQTRQEVNGEYFHRAGVSHPDHYCFSNISLRRSGASACSSAVVTQLHPTPTVIKIEHQ
jgi:hypothetical protein